MANTRTASANLVSKDAQKEEKPICGLIMPISETVNHSEEHWTNVQILLHRAIAAGGFTPQNVWENTSKDRVSERIIGNIFRFPILVADISDLNPNVMLELGLRLASKKPTVVISQDGGDIPFDIRDFHAVFYPPDMNMLAMEEFFTNLAKILQEKHASYASDKYIPFLGGVIVDVVAPETREVGVNELLLSQLQDINRRISFMEFSSRRARNQSIHNPVRSDRTRGVFEVEIPMESVDSFAEDVSDDFIIDRVEKLAPVNGLATLKVHYSGASSFASIRDVVGKTAKQHGGEIAIPF